MSNIVYKPGTEEDWHRQEITRAANRAHRECARFGIPLTVNTIDAMAAMAASRRDLHDITGFIAELSVMAMAAFAMAESTDGEGHRWWHDLIESNGFDLPCLWMTAAARYCAEGAPDFQEQSEMFDWIRDSIAHLSQLAQASAQYVAEWFDQNVTDGDQQRKVVLAITEALEPYATSSEELSSALDASGSLAQSLPAMAMKLLLENVVYAVNVGEVRHDVASEIPQAIESALGEPTWPDVPPMEQPSNISSVLSGVLKDLQSGNGHN